MVIQPLNTGASNVLGRTIPLYASFVSFIVGCVVFALARNAETLIVGRLIQGLGGGGLDILGEIITADITTLKERPLYLGLLGIPLAGGTILGPLLGALFAQYATWKWIGWINVPIAGVAFLLVLFFLRQKPLEGSLGEKLRLMDWVGMLLFLVGCTAFALPLSWGGALFPWRSWQTLVPLLLGACVLALFAWWESWCAVAMMPHRLFRSVTAGVVLAGTFVHGMVVYTLLLYLPLLFQAIFLQTELQAMVTMLPLTLSVVAASCLSGVVVDFLRQYRSNIWLGWVFLSVGIGLLSLLNSHSSLAIKIISQLIAGMGNGILSTILVIPMQASVVDVEDTGLAVGIQVFFRLCGALFGIALGTTIFDSTFETAIKKLDHLADSLAALQDKNQAISFIPSLRRLEVPEEDLEKVLNVYSESISAICYALVGFAVVAAILSVFMKEISMERVEMGRQQLEETK